MRRTGRDRPLYMISVAAELAGVHPQTLRIYERKQLISPQRSGGNTRLYSQADIERLQLIQHLPQADQFLPEFVRGGHRPPHLRPETLSEILAQPADRRLHRIPSHLQLAAHLVIGSLG